ncbi:uncharacterized protein VTP21DRAFT_7070 [Calcarisporiella thermophila]|uniref:uncharacterized protein n=1 Tax=Calcarisporiella thermophila TaxID=911321 RepID=UPI003742F84D
MPKLPIDSHPPSRNDNGLSANITIENEDWYANRNYGIVIDAGSSGSRVQVYSWKSHSHVQNTVPLEQLRWQLPVVQRGDKEGLKWQTKVDNGISTYQHKPADVGKHLTPLLNFAKEVVPVEKIKETPVYLFATAGMRLLPTEDARSILEHSCNFIRDHYDFKIGQCEEHVKVISGEREGIYGWLAVNYLMGGFDVNEKDNPPTKDHTHPWKPTFGFLDMGGASTQIAFEPTVEIAIEHSHDLTKLSLPTLGGKVLEYNVFVTTFLGYGSNEARRRYIEELVRMQASAATKAGKNGISAPKLENHLLSLEDPCLPSDLILEDTHTSVPVKLHGTGQFSECLKNVFPLLNKTTECVTKPCLFNGVHTPRIDFSVNHFVGISEYWYSSHDILGLGGVYDFVEYERKATEYCSTPWNRTLSDHRHEGDIISSFELQRLELQCFKSAWIVNVLHEGIELPRIVDPGGKGSKKEESAVLEQSIQSVQNKDWVPPFQSINTINDIQVSWTLGAILMHATQSIPPIDKVSEPHTVVPEPAFIPISKDEASTYDYISYNTVVIVGIILCCLGVWWLISRRKMKRIRSDSGSDVIYSRLETGAGSGGLSGGGLRINRMLRPLALLGRKFSSLLSSSRLFPSGWFGSGSVLSSGLSSDEDVGVFPLASRGVSPVPSGGGRYVRHAKKGSDNPPISYKKRASGDSRSSMMDMPPIEVMVMDSGIEELNTGNGNTSISNVPTGGGNIARVHSFTNLATSASLSLGSSELISRASSSMSLAASPDTNTGDAGMANSGGTTGLYYSSRPPSPSLSMLLQSRGQSRRAFLVEDSETGSSNGPATVLSRTSSDHTGRLSPFPGSVGASSLSSTIPTRTSFDIPARPGSPRRTNISSPRLAPRSSSENL